MVRVVINRVENGRFLGVVLRLVDRRWVARDTKGRFIKAENARRARSKAFTPPPKPVPEPPKPEPVAPVERVTVGTGISVENRSSRGLKLNFTWEKVVLRSEVEDAKREGQAWIREKFKEVAGKLSKKYLKEWGLEDMMNFEGYKYPGANEGVSLADVKDLGKVFRKWTVNGTEHKE